MISLSVIVPPEPIVGWDEIKGHLRAVDEDQSLVEGYIAAAMSWLDAPSGWLGRSVGEQTLKATAACFGEIACRPLFYGPVTGTVTVTYFDEAGTEQTFAETSYRVSDGDRIVLTSGSSWPTTAERSDAVSVTYQAGEETPPPAIKHAVMLLVGHWYKNREAATVGETPVVLPFAVDALLSPFRRFR
jgi:uncharacterized phiE125 gp8 family phage protein